MKSKTPGRYKVLSSLHSNRVISLNFDDKSRFCKVEERCDKYFSVTLNKSEMLELSNEIKLISEQMTD
tara:strand:+ start:226 stop:429 length:204 start_codon:yes stop_codon:yes gene_type:complete